MPHNAAGNRWAIPTCPEWIQAASAAPPDDEHRGRAPRLSYCHWAACDEPLIIIELRPPQLAAIAPGLRCWADRDVQAPFHRRGVIERTAAGAAVLVNGVLVASGEVEADESTWRRLETCVVAAIELGRLSRNEFSRDEELARLVEAGEVWLAEMPVTDLFPSWSRS